MTDIPIIFSAPMVCALIREAKQPGTGKTMTRRLAWRPWHLGGLEFSSEELEDFDARGWLVSHKAGLEYVSKPSPWQKVKPGDRLWVRETHWRFGHWALDADRKWRFVPSIEGGMSFDHQFSPAPHRVADLIGWWKRPGIFLPRVLSRLTLIVSAMKIERLQNISEQDAVAEGIHHASPPSPVNFWTDGASTVSSTARGAFGGLWQHLHGIESWNANPEVVALTFAVHQQNIGALA